MDADMAHRDDIGQQGSPMDPDTLALSQHEWLQFDPASAAAMRRSGRAILGEDIPWTRLFNLAELPTCRLITVEFLSTFKYRAHQAAVRVEEDEELPPDIEFSLCGQHFDMSIERFAVHLGIYYEPETVSDGFKQGLTQGGGGGDEGLVGPDFRYAVHRPQGAGDDDQGSSDQIHPPVHSDDHLRSRPEPGVSDYDRSLLSALTYRRPAVQPGTVFRFVLRLLLPPLEAWTAARPFRPPQAIVLPDQQQQDGEPTPDPEPIQKQPVGSPPHGEEEPPQHPPHVYRAVRLTEPLEALLHHITAHCDETAQQMARLERRLDRYEDLV
ncbi:hypothetical protein R6Q57_011661 [Mikania cordata]